MTSSRQFSATWTIIFSLPKLVPKPEKLVRDRERSLRASLVWIRGNKHLTYSQCFLLILQRALHHKIWNVVCRLTTIEEPCDVWVIEVRQDLHFGRGGDQSATFVTDISIDNFKNSYILFATHLPRLRKKL
jgi:hypothetical protein